MDPESPLASQPSLSREFLVLWGTLSQGNKVEIYTRRYLTSSDLHICIL